MSEGLKILCLGGGPSSLYFSILMKKANPAHDITVLERGDRDSTWGFGVVFSDETLKGFMEADAASYRRLLGRDRHDHSRQDHQFPGARLLRHVAAETAEHFSRSLR